MDPTRTAGVRREYERELRRRFRALARRVREAIIDFDVFDLGVQPTRVALQFPAPRSERTVQRSPAFERLPDEIRRLVPIHKFAFPNDAEKIEAFLDWLKELIDTGVLEVIRGPRGQIVWRSSWQGRYVQSSYAHGIALAEQRMREVGLQVSRAELAATFARPVHVQTLATLYTRNFTELRGITEAMGQGIGRVLADGFRSGWSPRRIATEITRQVDGIGLRRATLLARTEVIRAHAEATINRYQEEGLAEVVGLAELITARDGRVCEVCKALERQGPIPLEEARGVIPVHPNCRCAWLPVIPAAVVDEVRANARARVRPVLNARRRIVYVPRVVAA